MKTPLSIAFATTVLSSLAACGQSGPLYLPGNPSEIESLPAPSPASGAREDEEDEDEDEDEDDNGR